VKVNSITFMPYVTSNTIVKQISFTASLYSNAQSCLAWDLLRIARKAKLQTQYDAYTANCGLEKWGLPLKRPTLRLAPIRITVNAIATTTEDTKPPAYETATGDILEIGHGYSVEPGGK
jgi:hypothetical protein